jgi:hypothetical protein
VEGLLHRNVVKALFQRNVVKALLQRNDKTGAAVFNPLTFNSRKRAGSVKRKPYSKRRDVIQEASWALEHLKRCRKSAPLAYLLAEVRVARLLKVLSGAPG